MTDVPSPSTGWQEQVDPAEAQRFAGYAEVFRRIQAERSKRWGAGRGLHRKQLVAAQGTLEVRDGLPAFARHGLFARPGRYPAQVRLSNGGLDRAPDKAPDIRGFAIRVGGVQGDSALGGPASAQHFTLINQEAFAFARSEEFVAFVEASSRGNAALLAHVVRRYGLLGVPRRLGALARTLGRPFTGFATEPLYSALPMANGPYAVRVRLVPDAANGEPDPSARSDWAADVRRRLQQRPLGWDLQLQYFASEALTPIEDASVIWPTPYSTVARLVLPQQDLSTAEAQALAQQVEAGAIDPWQGLAEHRPLGEVQRARRAVYLASQQGRGAA
ncbi:catalase [Ramlibacter tataouinensis]|uniref:catalase n=1 Tax=Ramlibacter tataouinensis TaxID=94132 RepID=UPI0022F3DA06|nr:catalase [Ramlibacter tataouinensis]WBY01122.1 catalase [Ramlibacter tataouinensis]